MSDASTSEHMVLSLTDEFPGYVDEFGFPNEPRTFAGTEFDDLLEFCAGKSASDITIQTDCPAFIHVNGRKLCATKRKLAASEVDAITNHIYGANGTAQIRKGEEIDGRHMVVRRARDKVGSMIVVSKTGFRVNITACWSNGDENGIQITCRVIKPLPPCLSEMRIETGIIDNLYPQQGLVCICGKTGSGKSTVLAGAMREIIEDPNAHKKIITYEAPIEYVFDDLPRASAIVSQHEIPRHLPSFARGVRNALRRAPDIILVGETRDRETVQASLEASQTGHAVYTTVHSNSVANTPSRLAGMFPPAEQMTKVFEIIESLRLVVVQRLVLTADGKSRIALREFLSFDQSVRDQLRRATSLREAEHILAKLVERKGQTMLSSAQQAYDKGLITSDMMVIIERESKSDLIEDLGMTL